MEDSGDRQEEASPVKLVGFQLAHFPMRLKFYCLPCLEGRAFWGKGTRRANAVVRFPELQRYAGFPPSLFRAVRVTRIGKFLDRLYAIDDELPRDVESEIYAKAERHGLLLVPAVPMPYLPSVLKCALCGTEP